MDYNKKAISNQCSGVSKKQDPVQKGTWIPDPKQLITSVDELLELAGLRREQVPEAVDVAPGFPLRVTRSFASRIRPDDPHDPLLRQVLPLAQEFEKTAGYSRDPLKETNASPAPGLLHKYDGRVLLITHAACAVHCRYCFRRHFDFTGHIPGDAALEQALTYIGAETSIREVILSGGDPLSGDDSYLHNLVQRLALIPHLVRLRVHTRMPIICPDRITSRLLNLLTATRLAPIAVIHANHAAEINQTVASTLSDMKTAGITLLNQSVLLRGVNDSTAALVELSETLFAAGVLPYYLHMLDRVEGAAHFAVEQRRARLLITELSRRLPAYLVPRLVRETPGDRSKTPVY